MLFAFAILFFVSFLDNLSCPSLLLVWTLLPTTNVGRGIRLPRKEFRGQQVRRFVFRKWQSTYIEIGI